MTTPKTDPVLRTKVASLKEAHVKWSKRMTRALAAWFVIGVLVGLGTWFLQKPIDRDEIMFSGVSALGVATFFFGGMLTRVIFHKPDIKCPQCGCNWKSSNPNDDWLTWQCCPGCGLTMCDDAGCDEKP